MATCPRGHSSTATDYCDECGAPIGGAGPQPAAPPPPAATSAGTGAVAAGEPCPDCDTPRAGRFCELCGYDFDAPPGSQPPSPGGGASAGVPGASPSTTGAVAGATGTGAVPGTGNGGTTNGGTASAGLSGGTGSTTGAAGGADPATAGLGAPGTNGTGALSPSGGTGWRVLVAADRAYFDRMQAVNGPDAAQVTFPAFCPQRRFELTGPQLLIGRRSRSRGIAPDVDLTGPPEDVGVSHTHALLVGAADGSWSVVDLDSANGTYLNAGTDPIAPHTPVPLNDGDQVHVGAWTTLTVQRG